MPLRAPEEVPASAYIYEFVQSYDFPALDLTKTAGSVLCPVKTWRDRMTQTVCDNAVAPRLQGEASSQSPRERGSPALTQIGVMLGLILSGVVFCASATYGSPLAIAATATALPGEIRALSSTRLDVLRMVFSSYEFWYYLIVNSVVCGLVGAYFNDARAVVAGMFWLGVLNAAVVDAKTVSIQGLIYASATTACINLLAAVLTQFGQVSHARHFAVLHYRDHVLFVEDLLVNGLVTSAIILLRNAYRRHQDLRQQRRLRCNLLRCINYRCTVKLQLVDLALKRTDPAVKQHPPYYRQCTARMNLILHLDTGTLFDASKTFYPVELTGDPWPRLQRFLLASTALLGLALTVLGFAISPSTPGSLAVRTFAAGLALTTGVCTIAWGMYQVKLLRQLLVSFDFIFLSLQLSAAHLCVGDMFRWDARCLGLLSSWLWVHVVLTADALTPVVRKKLGFRSWFLGIPLLIFTLGQALLTHEIVFGNRWVLRDRRIHTISVNSYEVEYRVITFFLNRLVTIFLWSLRLLWRIVTARPDDAMMLRGRVGYAYMNDPEKGPTAEAQDRAAVAGLSEAVPIDTQAVIIPVLTSSFNRAITSLFLGSVVAGMLVCLLPVASGRALAVIALLGLPPSLTVITSLRYDIVRLLMATYECWFFTLTTVVSCALLGVYLLDARALIIPTLLSGTLASIFVDANSSVDRGFVLASAASVVYVAVLLAYASLHLVDEAQHIVLFRTDTRSLSVEDALVNGWATIMVLTGRNVYRKRVALMKRDTNPAVQRQQELPVQQQRQYTPIQQEPLPDEHLKADTTVFCAACAAMYQRQLLRRLVFSFDFAFHSFQLTTVHLCACDLVRWDSSSLVVCASWLWMHWVLAIDALTPLVQRRLGFRSRAFALPVVALFVVCQLAVAADIVFSPHSSLQDRVVFEVTLSAGHRLQVRVVPFLLSRIVTLLSWSLRIMWRLWTLNERESELVVIQGGVSYFCPRRHERRANGQQAKRASVVPTGDPDGGRHGEVPSPSSR
ncbi:hypothetical protein PybrP1_001224 [[Pythium] brassicae (nom. inval.)]|nr:hypothetical protein PybrP1_001224 [[Pythium] brassicae (nom. inval.)]